VHRARRQLVQATAAKLRELIVSREPGAQIGSLNEVAQLLNIGIVTVQQAARILEHEGLLARIQTPSGTIACTQLSAPVRNRWPSICIRRACESAVFCPGPVATAVMSNIWTRSANGAFRGPGSEVMTAETAATVLADAFIQEKVDEFARGDYGRPSSANLQRN
jgi:DNA-binding transcriptional MocR family regulator